MSGSRASGSVVLDAQGLVKLAAGDPAVRARTRVANELGRDLCMAASTLTEILRGGPRDAAVHRVLRWVKVIPVNEELGRAAGELLGQTGLSGHQHALDALVAAVALAQQRPVVLLTSDPDDMSVLTEEPQRHKKDRITVVSI
jgi:predicted nucleic acid-binding protein